MGQKLGKAKFVAAAEPFSNLPRRAISNLWQVFNDIADGFGISKDELEEICADLKDEMNLSRIAMIGRAEALFIALDTDKNGLVDALEFMSAISAISGMGLQEVIDFILTCYDFDGSQMLSIDEVTLALKSTSTGLCKLCYLSSPKEDLIEQLVAAIFSEQTGAEADDSMKLRITVLTTELCSHPDIRSWYAYFANPSPYGVQYYSVLPSDVDYDKENPCVDRSQQQQKVIDWDVRCQVEAAEYDFAKNPWVSSVAMLTPVQYSNQAMQKTPPNESLSIEWIYGYQAEKARNNVRYNYQGDLIYHISKYAIVYNLNGHEQSVFTGHTEEILCLTVHPNGQLVATGEAGPTPRLIVWHSTTLAVQFTDKSFHRNGIIQLAFSPDGKMLCTIGNDPHHTVCVFQWAENRVLFSSHVDRGDCLACTVLGNGVVVAGGDSYVYFWSKASEGYVKRRGNFLRSTALQPITCLVPSNSSDSVVSGSVSGQIYLWIDCNCVRSVMAHEGPVNSMFSCPYGILSGGKDRRVRMWTHKLEPGVTFDCSNYGYNANIRSTCLSSDGTSILIGVKSSEIFEISAIDGSDLRGGSIANGHFLGETKAIVAHPSKHEFATVADDQQLRIYDTSTRTIIKVATFDAPARAVAYSPLGDIVAVGLGGDGTTGKCGAFVILNELDLTVLYEAHDSTAAVSLIVYSPDGETIAVATDDGAIFLYAVNDEYELVGRCVRHTTSITSLDFSVDAEWIRSNSTLRELYFFNSDDASFQSNVPSMRDVQWATSTCLYTWHSKSIHRTSFEGEETTCVHTPSTEAIYCATGTSTGCIRLFPFPCIPDDVESHRFPAHVDEVTGVRFSSDQKRLISAGRRDRCIVQWSCHSYPEENPAAKEFEDQPESEDYALEAREGSDQDVDFMSKECYQPDGLLNAASAAETRVVIASPEVDVWLDSVVSPANPQAQHFNIPDMSIQLESAYGYKCQDMRSCVRYTQSKDIVYVCSTLGVVMNRANRSQKFFQKHSGSVSAFACSRNGDYAATGQSGHDPFVAVWDTTTCAILQLLPDRLMRAVTSLAFSKDSRLLCSVSLDRDHTVSVYDWQNNMLLSRFYSGASHVFDACFSDDGDGVAICGIKEIKIWSKAASRAPTSVRPALGEIGVWQPFLCCRYFASNLVVGTSDGNLYIFENSSSLHHTVKAHRTAVNSIDVALADNFLVSGGKDGAVRIWNRNFDCTKEIVVDTLIQSQCSIVRSVAFNPDATNVLVGTRGAEIFEVVIRNASLVGKTPLVQGHGTRELWGLAVHPTKEEFVTSGDDATVRVWDAKNFDLKRTIKMDTCSRAIAYSPDGKYVAVGFGFGRRMRGKASAKEGAFVVLQASDFKIVHEGKDSSEPIRVVKFSPDSKLLALGSEDAQIYVYNVKDMFSRRATIQSHKAPVLNVDFSVDGMFIMSVDSTKRIYFNEVNTGINIPSPAALKDERWATWSSAVGWPVQGMWLCQPPGAEPCSAQRSGNGMLLAMGNTCGRIFISHYPCPKRAGFLGSVGHAGPVAQLGWLPGDGSLVTIGSKDHCILQWKCVYDNSRESGDEGGLSCEDSAAEREVGCEGGHVVRQGEIPEETPHWQTVICPPSDPVEIDETLPPLQPNFDFAHGMRISDSKNSLRYNEDGHIVFIAATYGIIYNRDNQTQVVYDGHKHSVLSLDVDSTGNIAATGEGSRNPELHLWDARSAQHILTMSSIHRRGITSVSFSASAEYLVTLGQDEMHSIVVLRSATRRWNDGCVLWSTSVSAKKVFWVLYAESNEFPVVVGGAGTMLFFRRAGQAAERQKGVFGKRRKLQPMLSGTLGEAGGNGLGQQAIVTGTVTGHLYVWESQHVTKRVTAHDAPIYCITQVASRFATGGKDGLVKIWSHDLVLMVTLNIQTFSPQPFDLPVYALRQNLINTKISIGMKTGELYEVSLQTQTSLLLIEGHSRKELHGLEANPQNGDEIATSADDGVLRIWSLSRKVCIRRIALESASRAIAWSPNGKVLVVGIGGDPTLATKDGAFFVLDAASLEISLEDRKAKQWISDIKFSSSNMIGMASRDGKIYLHDATNYGLLRTLEPPLKRLALTRIDFSDDGGMLRAASTTDTLFHFSVMGEVITSPSTTRDVIWQSSSCPLTWMSQGVARNTHDRVGVLATAVNPRKSVIAVSYQDGSVRLYRFPCTTQETAFRTVSGIATQASRMVFSSDGKYLILVDVLTRTIIQHQLAPAPVMKLA